MNNYRTEYLFKGIYINLKTIYIIALILFIIFVLLLISLFVDGTMQRKVNYQRRIVGTSLSFITIILLVIFSSYVKTHTNERRVTNVKTNEIITITNSRDFYIFINKVENTNKPDLQKRAVDLKRKINKGNNKNAEYIIEYGYGGSFTNKDKLYKYLFILISLIFVISTVVMVIKRKENNKRLKVFLTILLAVFLILLIIYLKTKDHIDISTEIRIRNLSNNETMGIEREDIKEYERLIKTIK